ncbi:MAG: cation transporter [Candidatus Bathyarchaeota archaeon]|nr:MAG: cation transporter [Candidatus Bathyarchaeota archaeon]
MPEVNRENLRRRGLQLVWIGQFWNFLEAIVALWSAYDAGSIVLLAFGLDSILEIVAGFVLIWRLNQSRTIEEETLAENRALRIVGLTFFLLTIMIGAQSLAALGNWLPRPQESLTGIVLVIASAIIMTILFWMKRSIAEQLDSPALRAEAMESLICDLQDIIVLVGVGLNALFGWWWADPVAALLLIPLLLREGWEAFHPEND